MSRMKESVRMNEVAGELQPADLHGMGGPVVEGFILWGIEKDGLGCAGHHALPVECTTTASGHSLLFAGAVVRAALAAPFGNKPDILDGHPCVHGLAHVVDRQRGHRDGRKRLHFGPGLPMYL